MRATIEDLDARVRLLESIFEKKADPYDTWMNSPEGIAEYQAAIREMAFHHKTKKLLAFTAKTGGRVPRLEEI